MKDDRKVSKLLEFASEGSNARRKMLNKPSFKKTVGDKVVNRINEKELLKTENLESDTLIQEEVLKKVYEGAEPWVCMREAVPTTDVESNSIRVVKGEAGSYAQDLAEGGEIQQTGQNYTTTDITISKIGTGALVSNELVEDGLWDVVEMEIQKAGKRIENKLNRDVLASILSGVSTASINTTDSCSIGEVAATKGEIGADTYMPDTFVFHPQLESELIQSNNLLYASYAGTREVLKQGDLPPILGLNPYSLTVSTESDNWGSGSSDYYGLVYSKDDIGLLGIRRDITLKDYDDPIHDVTGAFATMRYGYSNIHTSAGRDIQYNTNNS